MNPGNMGLNGEEEFPPGLILYFSYKNGCME
jgi:hypothetical protein